MNEVERLRLSMTAAVEGSRRGDRIEIVEPAAAVGVTAEELAAFQATINDAIAWMREHAALTDTPKMHVVLAVATALGVVIAKDCPESEADTFASMTTQRVSTAFNQMRGKR